MLLCIFLIQLSQTLKSQYFPEREKEKGGREREKGGREGGREEKGRGGRKRKGGRGGGKRREGGRGWKHNTYFVLLVRQLLPFLLLLSGVVPLHCDESLGASSRPSLLSYFEETV